ncbi:MAG: hypothetical protein ACRDRN_01030 [Sciscionella sp.]
MGKEPEELLAEALRAQAARTPVPPAAPDTAGALGPTGPVGARKPDLATEHNRPEFGLLADSNFELLSGSDYATTSGYIAGYAEPAAAAAATSRAPAESQRAVASWVLLAALLLGLAVGAVAGLLTVL